MNTNRAVLVETERTGWADSLCEAAKYPIVSGGNASPLFLFTPSERSFTKRVSQQQSKLTRQLPLYLIKPEMVFQKVWASPTEDKPRA